MEIKAFCNLKSSYMTMLCYVMLLVHAIIHVQLFQCLNRFYTSESDVCIRQILTYKNGPRTERIKIFIAVVDP